MPSHPHLSLAAGAALLLASLAGCIDDGDEPPDPTPQPPTGPGCSEEATFHDVARNLARGGQIDVDIRSSGRAAAGSVSSTDPDVLKVERTYEGALITGVSPGSASLVVSRCGAPVSRYAVEVEEVAAIVLQLADYEVSPAYAALPGIGRERLDVIYRAADGRQLAGSNAAALVLTGGLHLAPDPDPDHAPIHESTSLTFDRAGQLTATIPGGAVAKLEVRIIEPSEVAAVALALDPTSSRSLTVTAETASGLSVIGFLPALTFDPVDCCSVTQSERSFAVHRATGEVTFTATVGEATGSLTHAF